MLGLGDGLGLGLGETLGLGDGLGLALGEMLGLGDGLGLALGNERTSASLDLSSTGLLKLTPQAEVKAPIRTAAAA